MDEQIKHALATERTIDITTTGRKTGQPRRIEIWFHNLNGRLFITGLPGKRSWYANLLANPRFTFHLKQSLHADLPATAIPITDPAQRRDILAQITQKSADSADLDEWVQRSPLIEIQLGEIS